MNYSPEQFFRVARAVEDAGGVHLDELCSMREYTFTGPNTPKKPLRHPGCGNLSLFEVSDAEGDGKTQLCAVCDDIGLMPRFLASYFEEI